MVDFPPPAFPNTATRFIRKRPLTLQEPQIERCEHQDYSDVHHQPFPEPVPEEQDVHADNDGYQREHVKHDDCLSSHPAFLVRAAERSQHHAWIADEVFQGMSALGQKQTLARQRHRLWPLKQILSKKILSSEPSR